MMGLIGLLFFVVAGHVVLSRSFDPEVAALMIGGGFLILAGVIILVARLRARRRRRAMNSPDWRSRPRPPA